MRRARAASSAAAFALALLSSFACARFGFHRGEELGAFRLSEVADEGEPDRIASVGLVLAGLEADTTGGSTLALGRYEDALRVDSGNPYAYLALARYHADGLDPEEATPFLDQAEALLLAEGKLDPRVHAHLLGLRGSILLSQGRSNEAEVLLAQAREFGPTVWDDGHLAPDELL